MLFALGFIAQFTIGGLSGVMHAIVPADTQQHDTYFVVAHFHYVLFGGLVFAVFGGLHYWYPKVFGRMLNETPGQDDVLAARDRVQPDVLPDALPRPRGPAPPHVHVPGRARMGRAEPDRDDRCVHHRPGRARVPRERHLLAGSADRSPPDDPWDARTLEWSTSSPPPEYNFAEIPLVTHRDEFWHRKYTEDDEGRLLRLPAGGAVDTIEQRETAEPHNIHMPSPSYWPLVFALGLPILGYGFVFKNWYLVAASVPRSCSSAITAWALEPATAPDDHGELSRGSALMAQALARAGEPEDFGPDHGIDHADDEHRREQPETRDLALPVVGSAVLRGVHRDVLPLPRSRRAVPRWSDAHRPAEHPVHVGHVVRAADELAHDGARARGDPARRRAAPAHLAARHRLLRAPVRRWPGVRVHRVLPRGSVALVEPVRDHVLHAHRVCTARTSPSGSSGS